MTHLASLLRVPSDIAASIRTQGRIQNPDATTLHCKPRDACSIRHISPMIRGANLAARKRDYLALAEERRGSEPDASFAVSVLYGAITTRLVLIPIRAAGRVVYQTGLS